MVENQSFLSIVAHHYGLSKEEFIEMPLVYQGIMVNNYCPQEKMYSSEELKEIFNYKLDEIINREYEKRSKIITLRRF